MTSEFKGAVMNSASVAIKKQLLKTKVALTDDQTEAIYLSSVAAASNCLSCRLEEKGLRSLVLQGQPYLQIGVAFNPQGEKPTAIVSFFNPLNEKKNTHWAMWVQGVIKQTLTTEGEPDQRGLSNLYHRILKTTSIVHCFDDYHNLVRHADLMIPEDILDLVLQGQQLAKDRLNERAYSQMIAGLGENPVVLDIVSKAGAICDGALTEYGRSITLLVNQLPMLVEESKSHGLNKMQELLEPYKNASLASEMAGWGTW